MSGYDNNTGRAEVALTVDLRELSGPRESRGSLTRIELLAAILSLGSGLRIVGLGAKSLWFDEAVSARFLDYPLAEVVTRCADVRSAHPPLYFVMLRAWCTVMGDSDAALRALAMLFGLLTILGTYRFVSVLVPDRAGIAPPLAALLVALSPLQIQLSQQVRNYSMATAFMTWSHWALLSALGTVGGASRLWIAFAALALGACYSHNLMIFVLVADAFFIVSILIRGYPPIFGQAAASPEGRAGWRRGQFGGASLAAAILAGAYAAPWLSRLMSQSESFRNDFDLPIGPWRVVAETYRALLATFDGTPNPEPWLAFPVAIALSISLGWLATRRSDAERFLAIQGIVPAALMLAYSITSKRTMYLSRYICFVQIAWVAGLALLIDRIPHRLERGLAVACMIGWMIFACADQWPIIGPSANPGMRAAIAHINSQYGVDEQVVSLSPFTFYGAAHYGRGHHRTLLCTRIAGRDNQRGAEQLSDDDLITVDSLASTKAPGVWLITSNSYLMKHVVEFAPPESWELLERTTYEQDRFYEQPVLVEHYATGRPSAKNGSRRPTRTIEGG
jgi:mannosyltransferase